MWGISRNICRAEEVELSAVVILTKPAVPSGPSNPIVPWNSADGNPCCHTSLEDGHGQAQGEEVRLVANASFPWEIRQKFSWAHTDWVQQPWVCGKRMTACWAQAEQNTESCWDSESLLSTSPAWIWWITRVFLLILQSSPPSLR